MVEVFTQKITKKHPQIPKFSDKKNLLNPSRRKLAATKQTRTLPMFSYRFESGLQTETLDRADAGSS
jgi:hypothetical protein